MQNVGRSAGTNYNEAILYVNGRAGANAFPPARPPGGREHVESAPILCARLGALRRLARLAMVGAGAGRWCCALGGAVAVHFATDRLLRPGQGTRALLLTAFGAALGALLVRWVIVPLARRLPAAALALEVGGRLGGPPDLLPSALAFAGGAGLAGASAPLQARVVRRAEARAGRVDPRRLVRWDAARRWGAAGGLALVLLGAAGFAFPATASTWLRRAVLLSQVEWPRRTRLTLLEAPGVLPRGEDAVIAVRAEGAVPRRARLRLETAPDGRQREVEMDRRGRDVFSTRLADVQRSVRFTVRAGDGLVQERLIRVVERPAVAEARMIVEPPRYISAEPVELAWTAPAFRLPAGSRATVAVSADRELGAASVRCDGGPQRELPLTGPATTEYGFDVEGDTRCEITLVDTLGIAGAEPLVVEVEALDDCPPEVTLAARGIGDAVTPRARLPLEVRATDDYGVLALWLALGHEDGEGRELPRLDLWRGAAQAEVTSAPALELPGLDLPASGRLALTAVARDTRPPAPQSGPQLGRSHTTALRLVTPGELLARLLVQQRDLRRDLEDQIARQEALVERFEAGGRGPAPAGEERSVAAVLRTVAEGYRDVLDQMLNNRLVGEGSYEQHLDDVVRPLRALGGSDGPLTSAAEALEAGADDARRPMRLAARTMERVRAAMLLLEGYAALVTSMEEIARTQQDLLRRTEQRQGDVLEELGIE